MIRTLGTEFVHFFLLEQDGEVTLIDAGVSGYRDTLEPALAEMGRSIDDVKAIVLTHADPDHVGFAGELQQTPGIPVYVHRADSERTRRGKTKQTEGSPLAMLTMLKHAHSRRALRHMIANGGAKQPKVPEVIAFDDGDELDVPGRLRVDSYPRAYRGPLRPLRAIRGRAVRRRRHQQRPHRHRTARRATRASGRQHLHQPGIRIAVQDRGTRRSNPVLRPRRPIQARNPRDRRRGPRQTLTKHTPQPRRAFSSRRWSTRPEPQLQSLSARPSVYTGE